jgi:aldose sugar dehydrogenase
LLIVTSLTLILMVNTLTLFSPFVQTIYAQPSVSDTGLNLESAIDGLSSPTSMVFLDNNILVLEKEGSVRLVSDGVLREEPVLQVPVNTENERGVLGVALTKTVIAYFFIILKQIH